MWSETEENKKEILPIINFKLIQDRIVRKSKYLRKMET